MTERKIGGKILHILWEAEKPMKLDEIAQKIGVPTSSSMGYLLGLIKAKYVSVPQKYYYEITNLGKQALGLPKIDRKQASIILGALPLEKAFHFHTEVGQYLGVYAVSLKDFVDKIQKIEPKSIGFHLNRGDFELWIRDLGDLELSKKVGRVRKANLSGENLRKEFYETVKSRIEELVGLTL